MNLTLLLFLIGGGSYVVPHLPGLFISGSLLGSILILVVGICIYLHYKYKKNIIDNKRINIDYVIDKYYVINYGIGTLLAIYDKNPRKNRILQDWYYFYLNYVPPYARPILTFKFTAFFPTVNGVEYLNMPDDGMVTIVWKGNSSLLAFSDSCNHGFKLDKGNEELWCHIPSTRRIRTAGLLGFITYYIGIYLFLPRGGGVWIPGPYSYVGMLYYKIKGYRFYSGGKPLLTRINAKGKLEIFVRDSV